MENTITGTARDLILYLAVQDDSTRYDLKVHKDKRSLNANNYAWALIGQIANVMRMSKEEIYLKFLQDYGQSEMVSVLSSISIKGFFKYYKLAGRSILNGKEFTHYKVYKGTSQYNTYEMAIFIDGVVQEAKNLGIETKTPAEIERLKKMWESNND